MERRFKLIAIYLVLFLLALPLMGCGGDAMILTLKVDSPDNDTTVTTPAVTVSGRVTGTESSSAKVTVNGTDVPLNDRKFTVGITLTEGKNVITINAKAAAADLSEQRTVTYTPAK